jgi:hypothetical protein
MGVNGGRTSLTEQLLAEALEVLRGWGGPKGLRQVGLTTRWMQDPYLVWAYPQARRTILTALEEAAWSPLEGEIARRFAEVYRAAVDAGLPVPKHASARYRQVRRCIWK